MIHFKYHLASNPTNNLTHILVSVLLIAGCGSKASPDVPRPHALPAANGLASNAAEQGQAAPGGGSGDNGWHCPAFSNEPASLCYSSLSHCERDVAWVTERDESIEGKCQLQADVYCNTLCQWDDLEEFGTECSWLCYATAEQCDDAQRDKADGDQIQENRCEPSALIPPGTPKGKGWSCQPENDHCYRTEMACHTAVGQAELPEDAIAECLSQNQAYCYSAYHRLIDRHQVSCFMTAEICGKSRNEAVTDHHDYIEASVTPCAAQL